MARPRKDHRRRRSIMVATTLTREERARLDQLVEKKDTTISVFVRGLIKEACAKEDAR